MLKYSQTNTVLRVQQPAAISCCSSVHHKRDVERGILYFADYEKA